MPFCITVTPLTREPSCVRSQNHLAVAQTECPSRDFAQLMLRELFPVRQLDALIVHEHSDFFYAVLQTLVIEVLEQVLRSTKRVCPNQVVQCLSRTQRNSLHVLRCPT